MIILTEYQGNISFQNEVYTKEKRFNDSNVHNLNIHICICESHELQHYI